MLSILNGTEHEELRLAALHKLDILDTDPESEFDELTKLAAYLCDVPMALVTLLDRDRQFLKSRHGLDICETSRDVSFCTYAITEPGTMVVPDATLDPRFCHNALVLGPPYIRFYAGVPLRTLEGFSLGTLCVLDRRPRQISKAQIGQLETLARQVMRLLELRKFAIDQLHVMSNLHDSQALLAKSLSREQNITEKLQECFLPDLSRFASPRLEIAALYKAALDEARVGGDFYDAFALADNRVALVIGDVVGKGLLAAALTAEIRYSLRILLRQSSDPSDALTQMNEVLVAEQGEELSPRYVSVAAAVLDTLSGEVQLTTAACEPAMVLRLHGATESFFAPGLPLGHESHARFETVRFKLNAGDTLLFVTDGLTEARHGKEFLEYEGVQRLAEQARAAPLADLGAAILSGAQAFAAGRLHDDACLLLVRMKAE